MLKTKQQGVNLEQKHKVLELYKSTFLELLSFCVICYFIYLVGTDKLAIRELYRLAGTVCAICALVSLFSIIYRYMVFVYHQLYVPLSKSELNALNIDSVTKYLIFLDKYLKGHTPYKDLHTSIAQSCNLLTNEQWQSHLDGKTIIKELKKQKNHEYNLKLLLIFFISFCLAIVLLLLTLDLWESYSFLIIILSLVAVFLLMTYVTVFYLKILDMQDK